MNGDWIHNIDMVITLTWLLTLINIVHAGSVMNYKHAITGKLARLASQAHLKCVALTKWKGISE